MSNNKSKRHTHKYHRVLVAGTKVWACALPDCPHYMPSHMTELVFGKNTYCWSCGEVVVMNRDMMNQDRPECIQCSAVNELAAKLASK